VDRQAAGNLRDLAFQVGHLAAPLNREVEDYCLCNRKRLITLKKRSLGSGDGRRARRISRLKRKLFVKIVGASAPLLPISFFSSGEERRLSARDAIPRVVDALNTAHKTRDCNRRKQHASFACCFTTRSKCHVIANKEPGHYFAPF